MMEHKFLRLFNEKGEWLGNKDRTVTVNGEVHDLDEYCEQHNIELPGKKSKKPVNTKEEKHADMEKPLDSGDSKES